MRRKQRGRREAEKLALRKKVGAFIQRRRRELRLSQDDLRRALGYKSVMSISDVELGHVGVPFKRIYQYADVLLLARDEFLRFVIGGIQRGLRQGYQRASAEGPPRRAFTAVEREVIDGFRRLPSTYRRRVREQIHGYLAPRAKQTKRARTRRGGTAKRRR